MNKSSRYLKNTMVKANALQGRYNALGASPWQAIRNPMPMRELILTVVPVIPHPDHIISVKRTIRTTALGKSFIKTIDDKAYANDVLGKSYWEQNALSVDQIVAKLIAKGFIVRSGTVACALNMGKRTSGIQAMRFVRENTTPRPGTSYCRYFRTA